MAVAGSNQKPKVTAPRDGEHFFPMTSLDPVLGGPDYSSAFGAAVEGEKMIVGLMRMPAGTGADAHSHPNEQWVFVLEGTLEMEIAGKVGRAEAGTVVYVPCNAVHQSRVHGDRDVVFFTVKDTSWGLQGIAAGQPRSSS
jgi:quercetin dioxygenase-like cupin family protein